MPTDPQLAAIIDLLTEIRDALAATKPAKRSPVVDDALRRTVARLAAAQSAPFRIADVLGDAQGRGAEMRAGPLLRELGYRKCLVQAEGGRSWRWKSDRMGPGAEEYSPVDDD